MASLESVINGRFKLYDRPMAAPGKCSVCGSVERPVVDFGLDVDFYGAVVICTDCLGEAAGIAGITDHPAALVTPLPIDVEALNEFFRASANALDRVNFIIRDQHIVSDSVDSSAEADDASSDGVIQEPLEFSDSLNESPVVERPNDSTSALSSFSL